MSNEYDQYYLPQQTAKHLSQERLRYSRNLGLILDKYPPQSVIGNSNKKNLWLKQLLGESHVDPQLAEQVYQRWQRTVQAMQAQSFTATTQWRMAVGLGGETVLETDLTLHHLYGIPFIPGSALKGLTRAYVTGEIEKSSKVEEDSPTVQRIFGTQNAAGSVIFFDALPAGNKIGIELDIMNAHYPRYYGEKKLPTNNQDPNPVTFLTVTNTTFTFALAPRSRSAQNGDDVSLAIEWLQGALQNYGVGGKTSAGYGYFSEPQQEAVVQPVPYTRPNIPRFIPGQGIDSCSTIAATDELQSRVPEAKAFLRYREFPPQVVVVAIEAEDAASWTPGQTKNCQFVREDVREGVREGVTVLICQAAPNKKSKKGKNA